METLIQDLRYAARMLRTRPGFTAAAVISLALGIGACAAIFSVVDSVLLRSLPYPESERIVQLREVSEKGTYMPVAEPNFTDARARNNSLDALAQFGGQLVTVTGGSQPVRTHAYWVSGDFFRVLKVEPLVGRTFPSRREQSRRRSSGGRQLRFLAAIDGSKNRSDRSDAER